jgi:SAM-dependent methyltransferase
MTRPAAIFDPRLLDARRRRALRRSEPGADFLLRATADDILDRLGAVKRRFALAVDVGSPTPYLADRLLASGQADRVIRMDRVATALPGGDHPGIVGDAELFPFAPSSLDLVVSALTLQWTEDLPGALVQIRRALKPDGLFLAALLGGDTLSELRLSFAVAEAELTGGAAPRVGPFADLRPLGALLQRAGFALPVIDRDRHMVRYDSALDLMRDLRAMGATNALVERDRRPLRRAVLMRAVELYRERFTDDDSRVRATFDIVSLSGWAPHESQQQPLKPGSARQRLADALGAVERPAGEKAKD